MHYVLFIVGPAGGGPVAESSPLFWGSTQFWGVYQYSETQKRWNMLNKKYLENVQIFHLLKNGPEKKEDNKFTNPLKHQET